MTMQLHHARSLLFLPASNARAIDKARGLPCDMVILDLEDAVPDDRKVEAREAALAAVAEGFGSRLVAVRMNVAGTPWYGEEMVALKKSGVDYIVLPKVETPDQVNAVFSICMKPVIAMIENPAGLLAAPAIARAEGTGGMFVGTNDLRRDLRIPASADRAGLAFALQSVVVAARAGGVAVFDGVFNRLDDTDGLERECREGHALGFDGKTLIHPNQIAIANRAFGPDAAAVAAARRLVEAATGGAERYEGRMIEAMHVAEAQDLIARAEAVGVQ